MIDSVIKAKKIYYSQKLLVECKYEQEKIKMKNLIDDDLEKKANLIVKQNQIMMNLTNNFVKS